MVDQSIWESRLNEYRIHITALQNIRAIVGSTDLDLPQICVVGDQSSGKSSLLAEITGINFPVSAGTCTRAPIVVECKYDGDLRDEVYKIQTEGNNYKKVPTHQKLSSEIMNLQNAALGPLTSAQAFQNSAKKRKISSTEKHTPKISTNEIRVCVQGPNQIDIIVIDLPGIIHTGSGKEETKDLINQYIKREQTLILLVSEAKQDDEGCAAIGMAHEWDPDAIRTLRVLTKCDTWDSDASKARMIERMQDQSKGIDKLKPHAVICRVHGAEHYNAQEEKLMLGKLDLPSSRAGILALKARLPPLYAELIRTNLPALEQNIALRLQNTKEQLQSLGEEPRSGHAMLTECQRILKDCSICNLQEPISECFRAFKEKIHATEGKLTKEWSDGKLKENAFECPFFQGGPALHECMLDVVSWWRPIMDKFADDIERISRNYVQMSLEGHGLMIPPQLCTSVHKEWQEECSRLISSLRSTFGNRLQKEIPWGTANHYLTSKFKCEEALPSALMEDFLSKLSNDYLEDERGDDVRDYLRRELTAARERWAIEFQRKSLHEQQQQRLHSAVVAVWAVEHKTFIDYILKETREYLISPGERWIDAALWTNENIKAAAVEDPAIYQQREELVKYLERMKRCMTEIQNMRPLMGKGMAKKNAKHVEETAQDDSRCTTIERISKRRKKKKAHAMYVDKGV